MTIPSRAAGSLDAATTVQKVQVDVPVPLWPRAYGGKSVAAAPSAPTAPAAAETKPTAKTGMNKRLLDALRAAGRIRCARLTACRRCDTETITGPDADWAAIEVTTDATPLSGIGEALALATGRATYTVTIRNRHAYLDYRDQWRITGHPADTEKVVAQHVCGAAPLPAAEPTHNSTRRTTLPDTPPF